MKSKIIDNVLLSSFDAFKFFCHCSHPNIHVCLWNVCNMTFSLLEINKICLEWRHTNWCYCIGNQIGSVDWGFIVCFSLDIWKSCDILTTVHNLECLSSPHPHILSNYAKVITLTSSKKWYITVGFFYTSVNEGIEHGITFSFLLKISFLFRAFWILANDTSEHVHICSDLPYN